MNRIVATVCRKEGRPNFGSEGASFSIELEVTAELIANPQLLLERGRAAFAMAEAMVAEQLERGKPDAIEFNPPPPARPSSPSPTPSTPAPSNGHNTNGSTKEGPPTNARELGGWAKKHGSTKWFSNFARLQNPPLSGLISEWSDEWARFAFDEYKKTQIAPSSYANGRY